MKSAKKISLAAKELSQLKAGDLLLISGTVYTLRDQAHRRLVDLINRRQPLPIKLKDAAIYYAGPAPRSPKAKTGVIGPTTSSRLDIFTPTLLAQGVKVMIGKGDRSPAIYESIKKFQAVYLVATGGAAAYLSQFVKEAKVVAFAELGPEAIYQLKLEDMPVIVGIDSQGRSAFWPKNRYSSALKE
jgi:fumarate hydratase subunit beta